MTPVAKIAQMQQVMIALLVPMDNFCPPWENVWKVVQMEHFGAQAIEHAPHAMILAKSAQGELLQTALVFIKSKIFLSHLIFIGCYYGLYLIPESKTCVKSKEMTVQFVVIDNPTNFGLVFSEYWQDLMNSISKYINVTISSLQDTDYTYKVIQSPENNLMAEVIIDYQKNISKGSQVYITLSSASDLKSSQIYYKELTENQTLTEMTICPSGSIFNNSKIIFFFLFNVFVYF